MIEELLRPAVVDTAYRWLCERRKDYPDHADVWWLRYHWPRERERLCADLCAGRFRFEPLTPVTNKEGETLHLWSARDALVLKALAIVLADHLPVSRRCTHVKGHGRGSAGRAPSVAVSGGKTPSCRVRT